MGQVFAGAALLGTAVSLIGRQQESQARQRALDLQLQQTKAAATQRESQRSRQLSEVLSSQVARQGASGFSLSSPSFNAIQVDSLNQFAQDQNADALNFTFAKLAHARESRDIRRQTLFGSIGDIFNAGQMFWHGRIPESARVQAQSVEDEPINPMRRYRSKRSF